MSLNRILKEKNDLEKEANSLFSVRCDENDLFKWTAIIIGPGSTPYEGGRFILNIEIPQDYPFKPPKIKFVTKIYHPNIGTNGAVCVDILRSKWSPALTISKVLISLISLLSDPNPDDPLVPDIADVYKKDKQKFNSVARSWTSRYAMD